MGDPVENILGWQTTHSNTNRDIKIYKKGNVWVLDDVGANVQLHFNNKRDATREANKWMRANP